MILDSFKTHTLVFQLRYAEAFLLWDRAGAIAKAMAVIWPDLKLAEGAPNQQILASPVCQINTGLSQATITIRGDSVLQSGPLKKIFETFGVWRSHLELTDLTRLSARVVFAKNFDEIADANRSLLDLKLIRLPNEKVFDQPADSGKNGAEIMYRFEDEKSFAFVRIRSEKRTMDFKGDSDFMTDHITKSICRLLIDFDRGSVGIIEAKKINISEWFKGYLHVMRRDIDKVLVMDND